MATRSTLEGVADLTKQLIALGKLDDGKVLRSAVRAGMKPAYNQALATMPVGLLPHRLRNKLLVNAGYARSTLKIVTTVNGDKNIASAILGVGKLAFYETQFVELGTRKMPARPWIRRALNDKRGECEEAFRASIQAALDKVVKG